MKREIFVGKVGIGGAHPVSIQSMTNTAAEDVEGHPEADPPPEERRLRHRARGRARRKRAGRLRRIVARSPLPVIADIHFDASLALGAMENGAHGIRINPGNIGGNEKLKADHPPGRRRKRSPSASASTPVRWKKNTGAPGLATAEAMVAPCWTRSSSSRTRDFLT